MNKIRIALFRKVDLKAYFVFTNVTSWATPTPTISHYSRLLP